VLLFDKQAGNVALINREFKTILGIETPASKDGHSTVKEKDSKDVELSARMALDLFKIDDQDSLIDDIKGYLQLGD
jgi:hypothetical protein